MYIKLCKHGMCRIVDTKNTTIINSLMKSGYKVECDESGNPKTFDMTKKSNDLIEDKTLANAISTMNKSDEAKPVVNNTTSPETKK